MNENINITIMLTSGVINGVKVNNNLFFRHDSEKEEDFYNKRIIPLLNEKGINFVWYYKNSEVKIIEEKDYFIEDTDIVNITKKQIGNIITANTQSDLHYDEQLYAIRLYEKEFNKKYEYGNIAAFREIQNILLHDVIRDFYDYDFDEVLTTYFNDEDCKIIKENQKLTVIDDKIIYDWNSSCIESSIYEIRIKNDEKNKQIEEKLINEQGLLNAKCYANNCRDDVLSGKQILLQESSYNISNMYGASNVGKKRKNQQDSYVILEHPQNKEFKLLAVADGMGGHASGEIVSNHTVKKLIEWFEKQDSSIMNDMKYAKSLIDEYLNNILDDLPSEKALNGGTTLVAALVGKDETLIINIGDSRVYTMKNGKIKQETKDQSLSQKLYERGELDEDVMRFYKDNNVIENALRKNTTTSGADYTVIQNQTYDKILLVSDGVTDCLSKEDISKLMRISKKGKVAENIVEAALNTDSILPRKYMNNDLYVHKISGGKDNTTAVYYDSEEIPEYKHR